MYATCHDAHPWCLCCRANPSLRKMTFNTQPNSSRYTDLHTYMYVCIYKYVYTEICMYRDVYIHIYIYRSRLKLLVALFPQHLMHLQHAIATQATACSSKAQLEIQRSHDFSQAQGICFHCGIGITWIPCHLSSRIHVPFSTTTNGDHMHNRIGFTPNTLAKPAGQCNMPCHRSNLN